jgi:hypothetical protein
VNISVYSNIYNTVHLNDFDFLYKMEPPRPEMDAIWNFKAHLPIHFSFFEPFHPYLASKLVLKNTRKMGVVKRIIRDCYIVTSVEKYSTKFIQKS